MKKVFYLLLCGLALSFSACKDDGGTTGDAEFRFDAPVTADVSGTVASVSCKVTSGSAALESVESGFLYGTESQAVNEYAEAEATVDGNVISCRLISLTPNTNYKVLAYADFGRQRIMSAVATFKTLEVNPDVPMLEITSLTTLSVDAGPDVYTITYEVTNPTTGVLAEASSESVWLNTFDNATEGEISFVVDANTDTKERAGTIVLTYPGADPRSVTVNQKAAEGKPVLTITSKTTVAATADEDTYTITYNVTNPVANVKAVASSESSWLTAFNNSEAGKITFLARKNTGAKRTGILVIAYGEAEPCQVTVDQAAGTVDPEEGEVYELTADSGFPTTYPSGSNYKLGDHQYFLSNVAIYSATNGIQFKKVSGMLANADDLGTITKVEVVYKSKTTNADMTLCLGDSKQPEDNEIKGVTEDQTTYTYDCSASSYHYFTLVNGANVSYLSSIKIYTGKGGVTPPPVAGEPAFTTPAYSDLTKNSATISGSYSYSGADAVSKVYFLYKTSTGAEQRVDLTTEQGAKSASLTGLTPATLYTFSLCVEVGGKSYSSASTTFVTNSESGVGGNVRYAGWPELPVEVANSDYYYAYHICPDFSVGGHRARNYAVCYSAENHCPVWVSAPRHACYEVKGTSRTEAYARDPDVPANIQYSSKSTGGGCNKGHMLGSAERLVTNATNKQVFYYTNIAPQLSSTFNTGGGAWNNLESFVDAQVCADTTYIVVGTYFKEFTDAYGKSCSPATIEFGSRSDVTRPSMFYYLILRTKSGSTKKAIKDCQASELKCAAFVLRHNMDKGHKPQAQDMMKVSDLEALTGFQFFTNVPNAPKNSFTPSEWGL